MTATRHPTERTSNNGSSNVLQEVQVLIGNVAFSLQGLESRGNNTWTSRTRSLSQMEVRVVMFPLECAYHRFLHFCEGTLLDFHLYLVTL